MFSISTRSGMEEPPPGGTTLTQPPFSHASRVWLIILPAALQRVEIRFTFFNRTNKTLDDLGQMPKCHKNTINIIYLLSV